MNDLVIHPTTNRQITDYIGRPAHALILSGPDGIGKTSVSRLIARELLDVQKDELLQKFPYFRLISPDGQSISIDTVREIIGFAKLKIPLRNTAIDRVIIIDQAHLLTTEAQNAVLKLLEEPPVNTAIILNTASLQALLPTIRSRSQLIIIQIPDADATTGFFVTQNYDNDRIKQVYMMSGGLPGLIHSLLNQDDEHPLMQASITARSVLQSDGFSRFCLVDRLSKNKADLAQLVFMLQQMSQAALKQSASRNNVKSIASWHKIHRAAYEAASQLNANAQAKLVVTNLMMQL